jgi:hypothetical protein
MAWSAAYRLVGQETLKLDESQLAALNKLDAEVAWTVWSCDELARALILSAGLKKDADFFKNMSRFFDLREHEAACRVITLMENPEQYLEFVTDSCRTNALNIFEAIALGNPYPKRYFSAASFDQMVVKAMFMGLPLKPIVGLQERKTAETIRIAQYYCDELTSAGRALPKDIELVLETQKEQKV